MKDEKYENNRHNLVLERISLAKSVKELPRITLSSFATFLADNIYFDKRHISSIEFKPFIKALLDNEMKSSDDVYEVFVDVLEKNYPNHSEAEYKELYDNVFGTGRISNFGNELFLRSQKIKEIQDNIELKKHNEIMDAIENATTVQELEELDVPDLMDLIKNNTKNEIIPNIPKNRLSTLKNLIYNQEDDTKINKEIVNICSSYKLSNDELDIMYHQLAPIIENKKIKYTVIEARAIDSQTKRIYLQEHLKVLEQINGALELKQLPVDFDESIIRRYLSANSKTYANSKVIPPHVFITLAQLLLLTGDINSELVKEELRFIVNNRYHRYNQEARDRIFNSLMNKFNLLDRLDYFVEEVSLYNERVNEFTHTKCSKVIHYGYEIKKPDGSGGRFFVLFGNGLDNMNYNAIKHEDDYYSFKEHITGLLPDTDFYGATIYKKGDSLKLYPSSTISKEKTSSLDELMALQAQLQEALKENKEQLKVVDQEINKLKQKGTNKNGE